MKKRLNELLNGTIEYNPEKPVLSVDEIIGEVKENDIFHGNFTVTAPEGRAIKCYVRSTNARIGWRPESFRGYRESFHFEADTTGLLPGDQIKGAFQFQTSLGMLELPYEITVRAANVADSFPEFTLDEFVQMAKEDFSGAYVLFLSKEFQRNLKNWGDHYVNLYRGVREQQVTYMSLEQFLVGAKKKEQVKLTLDKERLFFMDVEESTKEELILRKDNWGFTKITISSDAPFLEVQHPELTTEEFVGSVYPVHFILHKEFLHKGRNFARLCIRYGYQEMFAEVEILNTQTILPENSLHRQHQEIAQLMSIYLDYATEKIGKQEWIGISLHNIDNYRKAGGSHIVYELYETYLYFHAQETEKAIQHMEKFAGKKAEWKNPSVYGFYLCLTTLQNTNENYVELVKDHINTLFLENQENWILQLLMFYMNPEQIRNDSEKLDLIRRQYDCGCYSPILFLEAYKIIKNEPLLLRRLEAFEIHLLKFVCREHLLDREISGQTAQIAGRMQGFDPVLYSVLCRCFEVFPTKNMLTAICRMLISGRKRSAAFSRWYALGIKQDVRITGLYEYFMETADTINDKMLPQSVRMYFIYHNTLDYVKKAKIYANIIQNKKQDPECYEQYLSAMERFVEEQLLQGRINRNLAFLYEELLHKDLLTPNLAQGLEKVLFSYELCCPYPGIKEVIILHEELEEEQRVSLMGGEGVIQIYSKDAIIVLEDEAGNRYPLPKEMQIVRMFENPELEMACKELLEVPAAILIHDCSKEGSRVDIRKENVRSYIKVLEVAGLKKKYADTVRGALIDYFAKHTEDENLNLFLSKDEDQELLAGKLSSLITILDKEKRYETIFELVSTYGMEKAPIPLLVRMCHFCITAREEQEDRMLTAVCEYCLAQNGYDEVMIRYLMMYDNGSIEMLKKIWRKGAEYGLESLELAEKILLMVLFTGEDLEDTEEIFEQYRSGGGQELITKAYAILMAYEYFVREKEVKESVLQYLEGMELTDLPVVAGLALMKYLCGLKVRSQEQEKTLRTLVIYCLDKGMRFQLFEDLPERLKAQLNLQDKVILEYRTDPKNDVILHYQLNGNKEECRIVPAMFEAIFTKEFTMFYGDVLEWYFERKEDGEKILTEKRRISFKKEVPDDALTRYDLINRMLKAREEKDSRMYKKASDRYLQQKVLVDLLFPID